MTHRFILEPYKGVSTRHTCPECGQKRCFSRYIDTEKVVAFPDHVGRCDREQKCGYHFTPKEYFEQNPQQQVQTYERTTRPTPPPQPTSYIDAELVERSMSRYADNRLFQFLASQLGEDEALRLMKLYRVGTANHWQGSTVFWQIDTHGRVRTGKIMLYSPTNGRRIKEPHNHITWVHSIIHKEGFNLKQCFFGEHLLSTDDAKSNGNAYVNLMQPSTESMMRWCDTFHNLCRGANCKIDSEQRESKLVSKLRAQRHKSRACDSR